MNTRIKERTINWKQTIIFSMFVLLAAQINFDIFTTYFRVSLGIIMIPILIFLFQRIPLLPVTVLSGVESGCHELCFRGCRMDLPDRSCGIIFRNCFFTWCMAFLSGSISGRRIIKYKDGKVIVFCFWQTTVLTFLNCS